MKFFYDTEFIESGAHRPIELISIAIVAEDGRELYLQNWDCEFVYANDWVKENVLKHLENYPPSFVSHEEKLTTSWRTRSEIRDAIIDFIGDDENVELWGYYADYDHVILSQLFGRMIDLPNNFPKYTMDLKQWCKMLGNPKLPEQTFGEHHALSDARWNRDVRNFLNQLEVPKVAVENLAQEEQDKLLEILNTIVSRNNNISQNTE